MLTRFVCVLLIGLMASVPSWAELSPANLLSDELNSLPSGAPELQVIFTVAFSSELGVPLSKVKEKHPGHPWNTFSPNLLKVLQDREWLYSGLLLALDDRRVTKSKSAYLFENKAMSVADLAASILGYLLPTRDDEASATKLEDLKRNSTAEVFEAATVALLRQKTEQWLAETKGLGAEARAKLWLSKAHGEIGRAHV